MGYIIIFFNIIFSFWTSGHNTCDCQIFLYKNIAQVLWDLLDPPNSKQNGSLHNHDNSIY